MIAADVFRDALKDFPVGVTIVTTSDTSGQPLGATVSAFTCLSLDPPLVLVCLKSDSRSATAIRERGAFCVQFLDQSQVGLARRFAADQAEKFRGEPFSLNDAGVLAWTVAISASLSRRSTAAAAPERAPPDAGGCSASRSWRRVATRRGALTREKGVQQ